MPVSTAAVGKPYPPAVYAVGREKIKEFALATGETDPLHLDQDAARRAGYADVVAPPMFAVVYGMQALAAALLDPDVGIDFARMVHGAQTFTWGPLVVAGDEIVTEAELTSAQEKGGHGFFVFATVSRNQHGQTVCVGEWTNIVRKG